RADTIKIHLERFRYTNREELFEYLKCVYEDKFKMANEFVNWKKLTIDHIRELVWRIPTQTLLNLFNYMSYKPSVNIYGFPDLFLYKNDSQVFLLSEVKGPGDQLQPSQKKWLRYFKKMNLPHVVIHVIFEEAPRGQFSLELESSY